MDLKTLNFTIKKSYPVFQDDFSDNRHGWEVTENKNEKAFFRDGSYHMENTDDQEWTYYKQKFPARIGEGWMIDTEILVTKPHIYGHFGLVWGFDEKREILNRFTLSGDKERVLILQFQKDHARVYYRFNQDELCLDESKRFRFTIIRTNSWFHFLINHHLIHVGHESHFAEAGPYFGFYIEPGVAISTNRIQVKKLEILHRLYSGYMALMDQY